MKNLDSIEKYFKLFSNKDLDGLQKMFSPSITLTDWEINADGIEAVVTSFHNIFNNISVIDVTRRHTSTDDNKTFYCMIEIDIDNQKPLKVIDVIEFDDSGAINLISAYKQ